MNFEANEVINGTYGFVFDENGKEIQGTQEFEAKLEFEKAEIKKAGQFMTGNKITGAKGTGSIKLLKLDTRLQKKIAEKPLAKYNYVGKLADPTARGQEAVLLLGVSFDSVQLMAYTVGELAEVELDFTFDGYRYTQTIN